MKMKRKSKRTASRKPVIDDTICSIFLKNYDESHPKRKPWMKRLEIIEFNKEKV